MQDSNAKYTPLADLAARSGTSVPCAGNLPVKLDDPDKVWFIEQGEVNLFLFELRDGVQQAAPQFLMQRDAGWMLPGVRDGSEAEDGNALCLVAKGLPGTILKRLPASLLSEVHPAELAEHADAWLNSFTDTLSRYASHLPRPTALAEPGRTQVFPPSTLSVQRSVAWVSSPPRGTSLFMDIVDQAELTGDAGSQDAVLPLTRTSWLTLLEEVELSCSSTESLARRGILLAALASFHAVALALERLNRRLAVVDDANLERARTTSRRLAERTARRRLLNLYDLPLDEDAEDKDKALVDAMRIVGRHEGIRFRFPARSGPFDPPVGVSDVLDASGVRARRVQFREEGSWWLGDSTALLAFRKADGQPVALLPGLLGRYREIDPVSGHCRRMTADRAGRLEETAWMFHRSLPSNDVGPSDLFRMALHGSAGELVRLVVAGLPGGLIKLLPALGLGIVAHQVAIGGGTGVIHAVALAIAGFGLLGALLHLLQGTAIMRLEGRSASRVEAAVWDRFMRLPTGIMHQQSAGDLAMFGMTFQNLRDGVQGFVANGLLSIIFLIPVFGVIFFLDAALGTTALVVSLISLLVTTSLGLLQIEPRGRLIGASRRVAGRLYQIVCGISKLRVENAEGSAFAIWAQDYRRQKRAELNISVVEGHVRAFGAALPYLSAGILLFAVMAVDERTFPVSDFLIAYTVFIAFQSAVARFGESFSAVCAMLPAFRQMRPLLSAVPDSEVDWEPVEDLGGDVLFDRISFRYGQDGPLILDDVTIRARPGEFIAIAGESGAGKSTLFRIALGIDQPTAGSVYYDGRDLRNLNLKQLRRKIGSVPQSVGLHAQDLWDNLVSHRDTIESADVWKAIRLAEVEGEIKRMPMGMMTMVSSSGSVLSGGESQRVAIARSVVGNPRVMLLDEATNWLDNENQSKVMKNLSSLTSTRIVIAHRLSTLEKADRIYVMKAGRIVQSGTFGELVEVDGVFRELVRRQIA